MPQRVQRKRVKGQPGIPAGAVYIGRPSDYANPFTVARETCYEPSRQWVVRWWPNGPIHTQHASKLLAARAAVECFTDWASQRTLDSNLWARDLIVRHVRLMAALDRGDLVGKDVACWCGLLDPCHGDPLLKIVADHVPAPVSQEGGKP